MNISRYLGTCSLFCLIGGGESPGKVCDIGFETACMLAHSEFSVLLVYKDM